MCASKRQWLRVELEKKQQQETLITIERYIKFNKMK